MQVMVPNANGTLLGGAIGPGAKMMNIVEVDGMGSP